MLNKLVAFCREYELLQKGDMVVCAVSGGADSMALLWAMYLLKDAFCLRLFAAHYNHGLRGEESDTDAAFVKEFCERYDIPLYMAQGKVTAGKKGLEAAARDARYAFFASLPGKLATAHTADDNAETVLMHMVRGTGLKGLGGITPSRGRLIRPMLQITRADVLEFLEEYHIPYITDSSNYQDSFLRNRLRHHAIPLLRKENPRLAENLSAMALRLRADEKALSNMVEHTDRADVLRSMEPALRYRALAALLEKYGVKEPTAEHISLAERLAFSDNPSASANFPGGIVIAKNYGTLERRAECKAIEPTTLPCPGQLEFGDIRILCLPAEGKVLKKDRFTVSAHGPITVRARQPGDQLRLSGGKKKLKELFIDLKIPICSRPQIPVLADASGILGVYGIGANLDRVSDNGVEIRFEKI